MNIVKTQNVYFNLIFFKYTKGMHVIHFVNPFTAIITQYNSIISVRIYIFLYMKFHRKHGNTTSLSLSVVLFLRNIESLATVTLTEKFIPLEAGPQKLLVSLDCRQLPQSLTPRSKHRETSLQEDCTGTALALNFIRTISV